VTMTNLHLVRYIDSIVSCKSNYYMITTTTTHYIHKTSLSPFHLIYSLKFLLDDNSSCQTDENH